MKQKIESKYGTLVGVCGVDSGQIMLTDPCYVRDFVDEMANGEEFDGSIQPNHRGEFPYTYNGACSATLSDEMAGQLGACQGVVVTTGWGDGLYPVYVTYSDDGRIATATISFLGDDDKEF